MNTKTVLGTFISAVFYLVSCKCSTKTIDCLGYQGTKIKNWFDYSDNQVLSFKTASGEQRIFTLKNTLTTEPYQATSSWTNSAVCNAEQRFESVEKDATGRSKFSIANNEEADLTGYAGGNIDSTYLSFEHITTDTIYSVRIGYVAAQAKFNNSISLDSKVFSNVIEATADTSNKKQAGIYKVYVAKQNGLVAFAEYPSLKLWVKQ